MSTGVPIPISMNSFNLSIFYANFCETFSKMSQKWKFYSNCLTIVILHWWTFLQTSAKSHAATTHETFSCEPWSSPDKLLRSPLPGLKRLKKSELLNRLLNFDFEIKADCKIQEVFRSYVNLIKSNITFVLFANFTNFSTYNGKSKSNLYLGKLLDRLLKIKELISFWCFNQGSDFPTPHTPNLAKIWLDPP